VQRYRNHPIYRFALPAPGKLWRSIGMVFDPERPAREIKRLECADIVSVTSEEAEKYALRFCRAWIDEPGLPPNKSN